MKCEGCYKEFEVVQVSYEMCDSSYHIEYIYCPYCGECNGSIRTEYEVMTRKIEKEH